MNLKTTLINSPTAQYTDKELSLMQDIVFSSGYFADQNGNEKVQVVQKTNPLMAVDITAGIVLMAFTKSGLSWKITAELATNDSFTIANNTSGATRVDSVIIKASTNVSPNVLKTNIASTQLVVGNSTTPLTDSQIQTAISANFTFIRLANISVQNGSTQILTSDISNVLEKVKITPAVNIDASSVIYNTSSSGGDFITEFAPVAIPEMSPVSLYDTNDYKTDELIHGIGESVVQLTGTDQIGSYRSNVRAGIYTLFGFDWVFFLVNGILHYSRKVENSSLAFSNKVSTGISVQDQNNSNFTMGCDEKSGKFFFVYSKNAGTNDGKLYYKMAQASAVGLVFTSETIAWQDSNFKFVTNQSTVTQKLDSEFINGKYYVIFQNTNNLGSFKCTVIGNQNLLGAWVNVNSTPHDIDSDYANALHGVGGSIGCIDGIYAGVTCLKITAGTPRHENFAVFKTINTETGSFSGLETIANLGQNNQNYDFDMVRFSSVSFLNKRACVSIQKSLAGGYGEDNMLVYKKTKSGNWVNMLAISKEGFEYSGVLLTTGNRLFGTMVKTQYGASQLFNTPQIASSTDGVGQNNDYMLPSRNPNSNQFGLVSWTRAVQNGKGIQNSFGLIFSNGQNTLINYYKTYNTIPKIYKTDFNDETSRSKFIGINQVPIPQNSFGSVKVSGLITITELINSKETYFFDSAGISNAEKLNSLKIGLAINKNTLNIGIESNQDFSSRQNQDFNFDGYTTVVSSGSNGSSGLIFEPDYDGEILYTFSGYNEEYFKNVLSGDKIPTVGMGSLKYRRLQKN